MLRTPLPFALAALLLAGCPEAEGPRYATEFTAVELYAADSAPLRLAVHACVGLRNAELGGSAYALDEPHDAAWLDELGLAPAEILGAEAFLRACADAFPACVRYDYATQQALLPAILTAAAASDALPLAAGLPVDCADPVLDATAELADLDPAAATRYAMDRFIDQTTGLAMLNPGYQIDAEDLAAPPLTRDMPAAMVDLVFARKLFVAFLVNGCDDEGEENALLQEIVDRGPWTSPVGVYGYNNSWLIAGYLHEAQTRCLESRNMGAIPTETQNLSFFATRGPPIDEPGALEASPPLTAAYDPTRTYVAFLVGDGDNVRFVMTTRNVWLRQRLDDCALADNACAPLTWSISPHLPWLAPDVLRWYYDRARSTGQDHFVLPPSGHLYAYPSSLNDADQDAFVAATERDAALLGLRSTVHWDWFETWGDAEHRFLPKYGARGVVRGIFPVNVPYSFEAFPDWPDDRFYEVLDGDVVLFRPRQWRGIHDDGDRFFLSPQAMADEIAAYPRGTVTGIYMTSDGGLSLENSFMELVRLLPDHVELVSADAAARLALEAAD